MTVVSIIVNILLGLLLLALGTLALIVLYYLIYFIAYLVTMRYVKSRFLFSVLEHGLETGHKCEQTIALLAKKPQTPLGKIAYRVNNRLKDGEPLFNALDRSNVLPSRITKILEIGGKMGNEEKLIPLCHKILQEEGGYWKKVGNNGGHYIALFTVFGSILMLNSMAVLVFPQFARIAQDVESSASIWLSSPLLQAIPFLLSLEIIAIIFYVAWPFILYSLRLPKIKDLIVISLPWRKKRLLRDFSIVLTTLLDQDTPERDAILMAAETTQNHFFIHHVQKAVQALEQGQTLPQALSLVAADKEFTWRITNAAGCHHSFEESLQGWHESLDIQAFRQEQSVAQGFVPVVTLVNGAFTCFVLFSVFSFLLALLESHIW